PHRRGRDPEVTPLDRPGQVHGHVPHPSPLPPGAWKEFRGPTGSTGAGLLRSIENGRAAPGESLIACPVALGLVLDLRADRELLVIGVPAHRVEMDSLEEEEARGSRETRLGGQPDLVVDLAPRERGDRALVEPRQHAEAEGDRVDEVAFRPHDLPVLLVDPDPALEAL